MLVLSAPFFVIIPLLILLEDGRPVFYLSQRLGKDRKSFNMIKFRTLINGAEQQIGGQLLNSCHRDLELSIGKFLRDTRIDEIPQFINILKGDMHFFGPRPERRAIYELQCRTIPGYDKRFSEKPGLFGFSQLFTPHGTPKRLRALVDNIYLRKPHRISYDLDVIIFAIWRLSTYAIRRIVQVVWRYGKLMLLKTSFIDQRHLERIKPKGLILTLSPENATSPTAAISLSVIDVNEKFMLVFNDKPIEDQLLVLRLEVLIPKRTFRDAKHKCIRCMGSIRQTRIRGDHYAILIQFEPLSPFNQYLIDKYVLRKSIF